MQPSATPSANDTRTRLVDAARHLFHSKGYHATSLAGVADEAAANPGSLYYFFKSKEALLAAVLDRYAELLAPLVMQPAFASTQDPIERIFEVLEGYRRLLIESGCDFGCPIGNLALEMTPASPEIQRRISANFDAWRRSIELCLEAARDRLPKDLDLTRLATFVLTVMEGGVLQARGHRRIEPFDASVAQLRDYFDRLTRQADEDGLKHPSNPQETA